MKLTIFDLDNTILNGDSDYSWIEFLIKNNKFYVQAGAGVVADSKPEKEYAETVNKAKALMRAVD